MLIVEVGPGRMRPLGPLNYGTPRRYLRFQAIRRYCVEDQVSVLMRLMRTTSGMWRMARITRAR